MARINNEPLTDDKDALLSEIESLKRQINRLKLEKDILERTAEIVKKDPGVDPESLKNKEKMVLPDTLRNKYPLKELPGFVGIVRSSYFYHRKLASAPNKYKELRCLIIKLFDENRGRCG